MNLRKTLPNALSAMVIIFTGLMFSDVASAATHWVSPTGTASWTSCVGATALSGTSACSLAAAQSNAAAGDTVNFRGGTYTSGGDGFTPSNSGNCPSKCLGGIGASRIVFQAFNGEVPIITSSAPGSSTGLVIGGLNWLVISGFTFQNFQVYCINLETTSSYNEIVNNSCTNDASHQAAAAGVLIGGFTGGVSAVHNWIHGNYFSSRRNSDPCGEAVDMIRLGNSETGPTSTDNNNTIEKNYMEYGGHSLLLTNSKFNVIVGNIAHNEPWIIGTGGSCSGVVNLSVYDNSAYKGLYGHRISAIGDSDPTNPDLELLEGNRFGFGSTNPNNGGFEDIALESPENIVRYNFLYASMGSGIYMGKFATGQQKNHVFNNTIYSNGKGWNSVLEGTGNLSYNGEGIAQSAPNGPTNNVVKNNIVYGNGYNGQWDICHLGVYPGANCSQDNSIDTVTNNWLTSNGDPKFTNPDISNPLSQNLVAGAHGFTSGTPTPDLSLQASSGAIDQGVALTTATASGLNSTSLTVVDALYFQDGSWGSDLARGVTFFPDWIAVGTVTNTVQIASVNYATNAITLASPLTWSSGAHVWLYKKSDGAVVLSGAAPDYGASEFAGTKAQGPPPPSAPQATGR